MSLRARLLLVSTSLLVLPVACGDDGATDDGSSPGTSTGASSSTIGMAEGEGSSGTAGTGATAGTSSEGTTAADPGDSTGQDSSGGVVEDLDMSPEDFACLLDWEPVRRFRITNLLGYLPQTLEVANSPTGGTYPVGTVIQLIPNEAMVKRASGWSPQTNDWEFFSLSTSAAGTEILDRGATRVVNQFGGNCYDCHSAAAPQWDLVCEQDHGCVALPIGPDLIEMLQNSDPRCD
ncbi:MAG: hypothetical protein AB1Z98_32720 [Nannocystaceae bacterium]